MIRLMGLPSASRCPRATVRRRPAGIELCFSGRDGAQAFDIDAAMLGPEADLEREELALLAELRRRGYVVRRLAPDDGQA